MAISSYPRLLKNGGFQSFLWTQFLGAFNDNVFKMIVQMKAIELGAESGSWLALAGAVFVLPFLLFAGWSGQVADRFSKTRVLIFTKAFEILFMAIGIWALAGGRMEYLLIVLFCLALQANFFSPAKYGILPEMLEEADLPRANGLLEMTTFAAIVLGASLGTYLHAEWKSEPFKMGGFMLALAVLGSLLSLGIPKVQASGSKAAAQWNPFAEVLEGSRRIFSNRSLWLTVLGISFFWFVGGLFQLDMLLFGRETLGVSETRAGLLAATLALGIGVGSVIAGKVSGDYVELGMVPIGSFLMGVFALGLASSSSYEAAIIWLSLVGLAGGLFIVPLNAYLQEKPESTEKGRIIATNNFYNMMGVVMASGTLYLLHDQFQWRPQWIFGAIGVVSIAASAIVVKLMPEVFLRFVIRSLIHMLFKIRYSGAENVPQTGGALIVSNHVSYVDTMMIGSVTPRFIRWMLWRPFYEAKWGNWFFRKFKAIPVSQTSGKDVIQSLRTAKAELAGGELVGIFPEGTLTRTGNLMPFRRGFERITDGTGGAIIPVWLDRFFETPFASPRGHAFQNWTNPLRKHLTVYFGAPITRSVSAPECRQIIAELGSHAWTCRKTQADVLPVQFAMVARRNWNRLALADSSGKEMTFGQTLIAGLLIGDWLENEHPAEEKIGLMLPSSVGGALANFGVAFASRIAVNLNFTVGAEVLDACIRQCELKTILTSRTFLEKAKIALRPDMIFIEDILKTFTGSKKMAAAFRARFQPVAKLSKAQPDDIAAVIFSSGSTGIPKGVQLTHFNILSNLRATAQVFPVNSTDCMLGVLPLFHSFGYSYTLWFPLLKEFPVIYHPSPMDAKAIGDLSAKYGGTFLLSTPTFCSTYLRKCTKEQFSKLRWVLVGAERLRESLATAFYEKFGVQMLEGYGCTEMAPVIAVNVPDFEDPINGQKGRKLGTVGSPLPGIVVKVVNPETFEPVNAGEEGLLLVNGPSRMAGYLNQPELTSKSLYGGYYITGDIALVDEDGFIKITDRLSRFSKIAGEMVPHLKIEDALHAVLGDTPTHVTAVPDEQRGERLVVLYTDASIAPADVWAQLSASELPALWVPKKDNIYVVDAIPTLGTGKTDLRKAKAMAAELAA